MISSPLISVIVGIVMISLAIMVFANIGGSQRRLRERVLATREIKARQASTADGLLITPAPKTPLLLLASWLGYQSDLPPAFAASPKIVGPLAAILGVLGFNLSGRLVSHGPAILIGVGIGFFVARFMFVRKSKAYNALLFRQIPDSMSLMLRAVRAGLPVAEAIRSVGRESMSPTQDEFARVAGETALGMPVEVALRRLADRTKIQEFAFFSVIIGLHAQTGGNLSETLENMADMVRRRVAMAGKARALSAEGRLSAGLLAVLPFIVALLTMAFNPSYMREFIINPNGPILIGVFFILLFLGLFISHLLIQKSMED